MEGLVVNAERKSRVVLRVQDLRVHYHTPRGPVRAVEGVGFELRSGERLGLVGESGSGKSTTAMALMQLIRPPGRIEGGRVDLDELELLSLSEEEMRRCALFADLPDSPRRDELAQSGDAGRRADCRHD